MLFIAIAIVMPMLAEPPRTFDDVSLFLAACPSARVSCSFENFPEGADLSGRDIHGVTFVRTGAALCVVRAADTKSPSAFFEDVYPFKRRFQEEDEEGNVAKPITRPVDATKAVLTATSGSCVLSPGGSLLGPGPDPAIENDDLTLLFQRPIRAFGFDLLSQSRDGQSNTTVRLYDAQGAMIFQGDVRIGHSEGRASGADFWGIVCSEAVIAKVEIDDRDDNDRFADCNIGFDSLRIVPQPCPADIDGDTRVTATDLTRFIEDFLSALPAADFNADGLVNDEDFLEFMSDYQPD